MDQRRKRAVILATLPASLSAGFLALTPTVSGNRHHQVLLAIWLLIVIVCFVFAMRNIISLKRDGNPY